MTEIESFNFCFGTRAASLGAMARANDVSESQRAARAADPLAAELEAYNRAFSDLELPWRWDVGTLRELLQVASPEDCVSVYVERKQAHLLRVYEKAFLRDLVLCAKERCLREARHATG
jgi:hypothetical protein